MLLASEYELFFRIVKENYELKGAIEDLQLELREAYERRVP